MYCGAKPVFFLLDDLFLYVRYSVCACIWTVNV